jgi:uncharacterized protein involved in exopolysaccharide biosynthesis
MKRILKLLARIYPTAWHQRYGAEFEALLEDRNPRLRDIFDILIEAMKMQFRSWSFVRITLACSILGALTAAALSFAVPPQYISQTAIRVSGSATNPAVPLPDDLKPLLLTLRTSTLDRDFLASLIQQKNLYPHERARMPLNAVIDKMLDAIEVKPLSYSVDKRPAGFIIQFAYSDPHLAQQVEDELVSRLVTQNLLIQENATSEGHPLPSQIIRVEDAPSLPQRPAGWNRIQKTTTGLLTGLLCGLILATTLRSRNPLRKHQNS